jgi:hypothetical protein
MLQQQAASRPEAEWQRTFYDAWLYAFVPQLAQKDAACPAFMRTAAWGFKELNAALGSWAELKHDTILYSKMPEGMGGGGPPCASGPAPAYVEPDPDVFYRLAFAAQTLAEGLRFRGLTGESEFDVQPDGTPGVGSLVFEMGQLADRFRAIGDVAVKELAGAALTQEDYYVIRACLGVAECSHGLSENPPVPIVAAVSGAFDSVLEVATGHVNRIYVVVPLEGRLEVAQGGVYSYYEFIQPRSERLTDDEWRERLGSTGAPSLPAWAASYVLAGGGPADWLFFRIGDAYEITEAGKDLNVRGEPSLGAAVLAQLQPAALITIVDGPLAADGITWWKVQNCMDENVVGWAAESQDWYVRFDNRQPFER